MGTSVFELTEELEKGEEQYKDQGMAVIDGSGNQAASVTLPVDMSSPKEVTITADSGPYELVCTTFCGAGHSYMQLPDAIGTSQIRSASPYSGTRPTSRPFLMSA